MKSRRLIFTVCVLILVITSVFAQGNTLSIPDLTVAPGRSIYLPIQIDNTSGIVGVQFTLTLKEGISLDESTASLTERADGHSVRFSKTGSNKYMAVVFSPENKPIIGRTGNLMTVKLTASETLEEGSISSMTLTDVVLGSPTGDNIVTGYSAGNVKCMKSPDLEVSDVSIAGNKISPNETISVSWQVSNIGGYPTGDGWSEHIILESENGTIKELGTFYCDNILNAGGVVSRNADISLPFILGVSGDAHIRVRLVCNKDTGEPVGLQENNNSLSASALTVEKLLQLSPENVTVVEAEGKKLRYQLVRSGDTSDNEVFSLKHKEDTRVSIPESVTIEKGQSSTFFYAQIVANKILDNDSIVKIVISDNGYEEVSSEIKIEDDVDPSLTITADAEDVTEGGSIKFTVTTERISSNDIDIILTCDLAKRFSIPSNIKIPAGSNSIDITVTALEDDVPNVDEVVTFTATAPKHQSASLNTVLVDNDVPNLHLSLTPSAISEAAGPLAVTAKLRRVDNIDKVVTVKLSDDSNGGIYYGRQTIKFDKGVEEVTVNLGPIDNSTVDGERIVNISAAVWISSCSCNASNATSGGIASVPLTVYDNDGPTLSLASTASVLKEGGEMTLTVKRNTSTAESLTVNISNDHDASFDYPKSVTIPTGKSDVSFTIKSIGNENTGDSFTATFAATSDGFATGNVWFTVSDQNLPDAQITDMAVSTNEVEAGGSIVVETTISNTGSYDLPELTKVGIYTSNSSVAIGTLYLQESLSAGATVVLRKEIQMPSSVGTFNVYAIVNDGNGVSELCNTNNSSKVQVVKTVSPYTININSDKVVYKPGEKVLMTGNITGKDVAEKDVEVYIINDNYRHTIITKTDAQGAFSVEYEPYSGQMGHFVAGACYPKEGLRTEMLAFDYYGIKRVSNTAITCEALLGDEYSSKYSISNPSNLPLSNVTVEVVSKPDNCNVSVSCPNNVSANSVFDVEYKINATSESEGNSWQQIVLNVKSDEGVALATTLYYYCKNKQGQIKAEISRISTTMTKGALRDYPFIITNTGKGETGKIKLELPSWMNSATPREMASLGSGDSTTIILQLKPTDDMQLNVPVTGSIGINCSNGKGLSLPFNIMPVSESTGTLIIDVCDEFTYYSSDAPHVQNAKVEVYNPCLGTLIAKGLTGEDGLFSVELPEGYYRVDVTADKHESFRNNILVDPGTDKKVTVNLSYQAVTVDWKVEETEVEDEYIITTNVKFETQVPKPIIIIDAPKNLEADKMAPGEKKVFNVVLTNKGLVDAVETILYLPKSNQEWSMEPLVETGPYNIAPGQSVLIPVLFTNLPQSERNSSVRRIGTSFTSCMTGLRSWYKGRCGEDWKDNEAARDLAIRTCIISHLMSSITDLLQFTNHGSGGPGYAPYSGPASGYISDSYQPGISTNSGICDPEIASRARDLIDGLVPLGIGAMGGPIGEIGGTIAGAVSNAMAASRDIANDGHISLGTWANIGWSAVSPFISARYGDLGSLGTNLVDVALALSPLLPFGYNSKSPAGKAAAKYDWMTMYDNSASKMQLYLNSSIDLLYEFFGNEIWYREADSSILDFYDYLKTADYDNLNQEEFMSHRPENVSIDAMNALYSRILGNTDGNKVSIDRVNELIQIITDLDNEALMKGYLTYPDLFYHDLVEYEQQINDPSNSMCAEITLQFSQKMVMTRQAFRGTLTIFNGNENDELTDIKLDIEIKDEDGNVATSHEFQINPENLTGFDGELNLSSGWTLDAGQTGVSTILFIPTKYAAPTVEKRYAFGGTLSYVDPFTGLTVTRTLAPVTLTVKPSPNLDLTYFMQRDIKGDDPLTPDVVEPCEEAEFSLLINNKGYGDATNVKMVTDQPKIIENEKGLHVDFQLMSSQLNGEDKTLALGGSVTTDFGTIPAMSTAYAQWWMKSSLLGHFTDYDVEATHVTSYDNPDLSLLNDVTIHELIRSVDASTAQKKLVGFMVNDIVDAEDTPDMMYLSDGEIEAVYKVNGAVLSRVDNTTYTLTVPQTASGWNYGNVTDPSYGLSELKRVVRNSDGKEIASRNFWQTDRTLRDGKDPLYENRIHFVDNLSSMEGESYTLTFEPLPELLLAVASIDNVPEEGSLSIEPLEKVKVVFNKTVNPETFTTDDIMLAVQGVNQDVSKVNISTNDNKSFDIDFSPINENIGNGYFVLTVNTSDITDNEGFNGKNGTSAAWIMFRDGLVALNADTYPKSAGSILLTPVGTAAKASKISTTTETKTEYGSLVRMETVPNDGYEFMNWTLDGEVLSKEPVLEYMALNDMDIVANFTAKNYLVSLDFDEEGGNVSGSSGYYTKGTELTFSAQASDDWEFEGWTVNGEAAGNDETLTIIVEGTTVIKALYRHVIYPQNFILESGWNWISSFVNDPIPIDIFKGSLSRIVSQFDETIDDPVYGMTGGIAMLMPGISYKVNASYNVVKSFKGRLCNLADTPMELHTGWNWISYPYLEERNINEVLTNATEGDYITSQTGFAEYMDGSWEGTLTDFAPGCGYIYKSVNDKILEFDFTRTLSKAMAMRASGIGYDVAGSVIDIHKYPSTMNIIAQISDGFYDIDDSQCCIYAFAGNECRGKSKYVGGKHYITVYGDEPIGISFVIENTNNGNTYIASESLNFCQEVIGSRKSPFILTLSGPTGINSINGEEHKLKIYTPDGRLISMDATPETLKTLKHGLYIINGQKYIVK